MIEWKCINNVLSCHSTLDLNVFGTHVDCLVAGYSLRKHVCVRVHFFQYYETLSVGHWEGLLRVGISTPSFS